MKEGRQAGGRQAGVDQGNTSTAAAAATSFVLATTDALVGVTTTAHNATRKYLLLRGANLSCVRVSVCQSRHTLWGKPP